MNINELVPNYETCKEAKELGFPQETAFYHAISPVTNNITLIDFDLGKASVSAPTLQEVLAELPDCCCCKNAQDALEWWNRLKKDGVIC